MANKFVFALVLLLVFSSLVVANTQKTRPDAYWRGEARPFAILEQYFDGNGTVILLVQNVEAEPKVLKEISLAGTEYGSAGTRMSSEFRGMEIFASGEKREIRFYSDGKCEKGGTYAYYVNITYDNADGTSTGHREFGAVPIVGMCGTKEEIGAIRAQENREYVLMRSITDLWNVVYFLLALVATIRFLRFDNEIKEIIVWGIGIGIAGVPIFIFAFWQFYIPIVFFGTILFAYSMKNTNTKTVVERFFWFIKMDWKKLETSWASNQLGKMLVSFSLFLIILPFIAVFGRVDEISYIYDISQHIAVFGRVDEISYIYYITRQLPQFADLMIIFILPPIILGFFTGEFLGKKFKKN